MKVLEVGMTPISFAQKSMVPVEVFSGSEGVGKGDVGFDSATSVVNVSDEGDCTVVNVSDR